MHSKYTPGAVSFQADDDNLISYAGLYPLLQLAEQAGLSELCHTTLTVPASARNNFAGSHTTDKVTTLIAGMAVGADSIDDMNLLRHGGMDKLFDGLYAPSTLGTFLRGNSYGGPAQFGALARKFMIGLTRHTPILGDPNATLFIDVDDKVTEVFGSSKHGAAFGYTHKRGLNSVIATATTTTTRPVLINQQLRKGNATSATGAADFLTRTLATIDQTAHTGDILVRLDSGFFSATVAAAIHTTGAHLSIGVRQFKGIRTLISTIKDDAWTPIDYPGATRTPDGTLHSDAAVAELDYTAFRSRHRTLRLPGRLIVRRTRERHPARTHDPELDLHHYRYHAFFTTQPTTIDTWSVPVFVDIGYAEISAGCL